MSLDMKLNPPQINNKLPAFAYTKDKKEGDQNLITIPFNLNRSVGKNEVGGLYLIIKTVQNNIQKAILHTTTMSEKYGSRGYEANFQFSDEIFTPQIGQYYKVQLACEDLEGNIGYYSSVGIIKCTSQPEISFNRQSDTVKNAYEYTAVYSQKYGDITEKVYSYCFNLYDANGALLETSGEQIHDNSKDIYNYESTDSWIIRKVLDPNVYYSIEYTCTTINGLVVKGPRETIRDNESTELNLPGFLVATPVPEEGYIAVSIQGNGEQALYSGSFILIRSSSEDGFQSWYQLTKFQLVQWDATTSIFICKDYSVSQGIEYRYSIQGYGQNGLFTSRLLTQEPVICDFEDAFLFDGERQLKIRFNPKVNNFKSTVLESKMNTIGGKYPFIFRNGNIEYKEFQISGLISVLGDEHDEFLTGIPRTEIEARLTTDSQAGAPDMGTQLIGENYQRERRFKLQVLDWLNNGKPKLFRSPAEGIYIIRLMNVSLTPLETVGRMLHSFTCTACEIAEPTFDNFYKYGFIVDDYTETRTMKINQIDLNVSQFSDETTGIISVPSAYIASITANPGTKLTYTLANSVTSQELTIGETGTYIWPEESLKESPLIGIRLASSGWGEQAYLTYGYYDTGVDLFSNVQDITITDEIVQQYGLGARYDELGDFVHDEEANIINQLEDGVRIETGAFHFIRVKTKILSTIIWNEETQSFGFDEVSTVDWNPGSIYAIQNQRSHVFYIDGNNPPPNIYPFDSNGNVIPEMDKYIYDDSEYLYLFKLNDNPVIDFSGNDYTDGRYDALTNISKVTEMYAGPGLVLDLVYQRKEIIYTIEETDDNIKALKETWTRAKSNYESAPTEANKKKMDDAYNDYLEALSKALEVNNYEIRYAL